MGESLNSPDRLENRNQRSRYFILAFAVLAAGLAYAFIVVNGSNELWSGFTFIMLLPMLIGAFLYSRHRLNIETILDPYFPSNSTCSVCSFLSSL
ncbi:hypothetical protein A8B75_15610 [Sphingomonadales bacterium EhC05]|nr:hypothetical protein A8B75_15610 [Sphingomonadales bacterium EhC05]